jgi:hypothetical protein
MRGALGTAAYDIAGVPHGEFMMTDATGKVLRDARGTTRGRRSSRQ